MQRIVSKLTGYSIGAKDGDIGSVEDFLFDDKLWTVRYLVADTAKWLPGRRVVISPMALGRVEEDEKRLRVSLTKEQVENSPDVDSKNFSRQHETVVLRLLWLAILLGGRRCMGWGNVPASLAAEKRMEMAVPEQANDDETHLAAPRR